MGKLQVAHILANIYVLREKQRGILLHFTNRSNCCFLSKCHRLFIFLQLLQCIAVSGTKLVHCPPSLETVIKKELDCAERVDGYPPGVR